MDHCGRICVSNRGAEGHPRFQNVLGSAMPYSLRARFKVIPGFERPVLVALIDDSLSFIGPDAAGGLQLLARGDIEVDGLSNAGEYQAR